MIEISFPDSQPLFRRYAATAQSTRPLMVTLGTALARRLRAHFIARDKEPNKRGWAKLHFWNKEVAQRTEFTGATQDTATVGISSRPFAQKLYGGTITPGPGRKYLAIPTRPAAYGSNPKSNTIPGLFAITSRVTKKHYLARNEGGKLSVYYRLTPRVTQAADPRALPPDAEVSAELSTIAERTITSELKKI